MAQLIKVLLIEDNRIEARQTQHWLSAAKGDHFEVECVEQLQQGLDRLSRGGLDIVLLDLNLPDSRGIETFVKLHDKFPEIPIVVLTGEYDDAIGPTAVEKGAQDYLVKQHANGPALTHVLRYALTRHRAQLAQIANAHVGKSARVIAFLGAKGGVGTTTTALNVATALAMQGKSVILAELRPSFGMLARHLRQEPVSGLRSLLDLPAERIGIHELQTVLSNGPSSLGVLFGPQEHDEPKPMTSNQTEAILRGLSQMAQFVILDLPGEYSAARQAAVNLCHFAAVVTEREPGSVMAARAVIRQLHDASAPGNLNGRITPTGSVVVTRTIFPNYTLGSAELRSQLGCEIIGIVPWGASENLRALNEGVPLVLLQPDNDTALAYAEIANRLTGDRVAGINV